jgi:hypothetical protein
MGAVPSTNMGTWRLWMNSVQGRRRSPLSNRYDGSPVLVGLKAKMARNRDSVLKSKMR